jgi:uridine kinase
MSNIELYKECKEKLIQLLNNNNKSLIILSGTGGNGKTTLINELKQQIKTHKYSSIHDITKNNFTNLTNNFDMSKFNNLVFDITENLDDLQENDKFSHINMNHIHF